MRLAADRGPGGEPAKTLNLVVASRGDGEIELLPSPVEEVARLEVREVLGGYFRSVGTTFAGGTTLEVF